MKIAVFLFALLIGMCLILGYVLMTEEPSEGHGIPHPEFSTMLRGGDGATRLAPVLWAGWLLGVFQIFFFVGLLAFGVQKARRFPTESRLLVIGALIYAGVFTWMVLAYNGFARTANPELVLSFPLPTAIMLYGVGFTPLIFIVLYLVRFEPWVIDDDDLNAFLEKVDESDAEEEGRR